MKYLLALVAAVSMLGFAVPATADAHDGYSYGSRRVVSYMPCGRPVYSVYQVYGYDRCGSPLGRWVTERRSCGCSVCSPRAICPPDHGHHGRYSSSPHYSRPSYRRSSAVHFSFGW